MVTEKTGEKKNQKKGRKKTSEKETSQTCSRSFLVRWSSSRTCRGTPGRADRRGWAPPRPPPPSSPARPCLQTSKVRMYHNSQDMVTFQFWKQLNLVLATVPIYSESYLTKLIPSVMFIFSAGEGEVEGRRRFRGRASTLVASSPLATPVLVLTGLQKRND